ncbi:MAG TPA: hypothetical protein VGE15_14025 [Sphingobacteriaceae bacterium]
MVSRAIKIDEEDSEDVRFWLARSPQERIAEVTRLRFGYYSALLGKYPEHIEKVVSRRKL